MSKEHTLAKVRDEICQGNLGRARDRMHGLISAYPDDLDLRPILADIYLTLHFPAMAGRYWYLQENKTEAMEKACEEFERSCGHDPLRILLALKFKGEMAEIRSDYAKKKLDLLLETCKKKHNTYPEFGLKGRDRWKFSHPIWTQWIVPIGCFSIIALTIILALIGVFTVLDNIF